MIEALAGESIIAAGSMQQRGSLFALSGNRDTCLAPVTDHSAETLLAIIKACIVHSTTVVSDYCGTTFVSAMMDSHTTLSVTV